MLRQPPSCAGFGELGRHNHERRLRLSGTAVSRFLRPIMLIGGKTGRFLGYRCGRRDHWKERLW
jgi:hypothetical protein